VKVATYNVNGVNGRLPVLLRWLAEEQPDIVCLQELKASDEKFPLQPLKDLGYEAIWQGQKSWNGVAILSKVGEIHETRRGLPGEPEDAQSRYIEAAVNGILIGGFTCQMAIRSLGPSSTTSCDGSSASSSTPRIC
jgi:exodeoxyribonuclease-3